MRRINNQGKSGARLKIKLANKKTRSQSQSSPPKKQINIKSKRQRPVLKQNDNVKYRKTDNRQRPELQHDDSLIRLNKYIANTGLCSRREADEIIKQGLVSVNGKVVTEMGTKVTLNDKVVCDNSVLRQEKKVYLLLNKPKDFVTTTDDPHAKKKVIDLVRNACKQRIYPVGRLDRNTTGVLLFTNDGDLTKKLTHPKYNRKKIYHVGLDKALTKVDLESIAKGVELEDGFATVDAISYISAENKKEVGLEIHSGKNRIVRRIFEAVDYKVLKLDRVYFAGLTKKGLPRGHWRFLNDQEVSRLKMGSYE